LFCVHPAGGDVSGFRELAVALEARQPMCALQAPPLEHPDAEQSIEYLAARYVESMRTVQPQGPYLLLGWSAGGLIAFEMARRLRHAGVQVGALTLVESHPAGALPYRDEAEVLLGFAHELERMRRADLSMSYDDLRTRSPREGIDLVLDRAMTAGVISSDLERRDLLRRLYLYRAHVRSARAYTLTAYDGPVLLIQASEQEAALREPAAREWRAACGERLEIRVLDGDHFSIMQAPRVNELAQILTKAAELPETKPV
jgi:thioesterase domain-containing protein